MIPVVINNRNRFVVLKKLIEWLDGLDVKIIILDNESTYKPLLQYYDNIKNKIDVVYLGKNLGHTALYVWGEHLNFISRYFVYTDSDIVPKDSCPRDLISYLVYAKIKYPMANKIGAGIEIKDIPDCYVFKKEVVEWESNFWKTKNGELFVADVDTTFAVYDNQNIAGKQHCVTNCLRTDYPYVVQHIPWYSNSQNLSQEELYYLRQATAMWTGHARTLTGQVGLWTHKMRNKIIRRII